MTHLPVPLRPSTTRVACPRGIWSVQHREPPETVFDTWSSRIAPRPTAAATRDDEV